MTDPNRLVDNRNGNTVALSLQSALQPQDQLDLVSAYFSVNGYRQLADQLEQAGQVRFLYGDPSSVNNPDPGLNDVQSFKLVESALVPSRVMAQKEAARRCAEWLEKPEVQVKSVKNQRFLHGKMYLVSTDRKPKIGIIGSSNFTAPGLGAGEGSGNANLEINLATNQPQVLGQMQEWFNELWNDPSHTRDVKAEVLAALARIQREQSPELIYFKTLYELFRKQLAEREATQLRMKQTVGFYQTKIWNALYGFQRDGVDDILTKLDKHNGCILADGVGLGKTYTALGVIKYHELHNERVLVICPKRLRQNWELYRANYDSTGNPLAEDQLRYALINHSDLRRKSGSIDGVPAQKFNFSNYDLVVIDESHNFRNHGAAYNKLLNKVIKKGGDTKVLLLSATPVNNALTDLQNQIDLMTQGRQDAFHQTLDIPSVRELLEEEQSKFKQWQKEPPDSRQKLPELLSPELVNLLKGVSIARSRNHIENSYSADREKLGRFPQQVQPDKRTPNLARDVKGGAKADYAQIAETICQMTLAVYRPAHYLMKPSQPPPAKGGQIQIPGFDDERQKRTEIYLTGIQKTIFLKRLESSIPAFNLTLDKAIAKMDNLIRKLERFERQGSHARTELEDSDYRPEQDDLEEDQELLIFADLEDAQGRQVQSGNRSYDLAAMDTKGWREALKRDRDWLRGIKSITAAITPERDGKLADLKEVIRGQARKKDDNRKLLVFTTYKDTAEYLYDSLLPLCRQLKINPALVSGSDNKSPQQGNIPVRKSYEDILDRFAPKARPGNDRQQKEAGIDLLIATDCISEGQNLQDCNTVVNYDIHWNPVRLIQRFGRIDRIGSRHQQVRRVDYWPTKDLDAYLDLQSSVMTKDQLVDFVGGEADAMTAEQDFRARQLKEMQTQTPDPGELSEGPNFNEFSLDHYLKELLDFLQSSREELKNVPSGSYAVVDNSKLRSHKPGAIFLLREKIGDNPEQSEGKCQLVYATSDRAPESHRDSILAALGEATNKLDKPINELCDRFNRETEQGKDMSAYDRLLQSALAAGADNALMEGQESSGATAAAAAAPEYELVTWLAILDRSAAAAPGRKPRRKTDAAPPAAPPAELPWNWTATLPPAIAVKLTTHSHGDVPSLAADQLYDAARKHWPVSPSAREQAKYVLAIHQDKVVGVYEPGRWRRVANESAIYSFTGKPAPDAIQKRYIGQDCPIARNRRVRYINMA